MSKHPIKWASAAPLWKGLAMATDDMTRRSFSSPNILRFATDSFMEDFLRIVERDPTQLAGHLAQPERWNRPALPPSSEELLKPAVRQSALVRKLDRLRVSTERLKAAAAGKTLTDFKAASNAAGKPAEEPLKLFQPAHQRYYLVTACLVCQITGLPDRVLDAGRQERAFYVLRRLLPPDHKPGNPLSEFVWHADPAARGNDTKSWQEYAHVLTPGGSGWQKLPDQSESALQTLAQGEEELSLFAVNYAEDDGRRRRLLAGVIPVGKRETLLGEREFATSSKDSTPAPAANSTDPRHAQKADPRMAQLYKQVIEPWKRMTEIASRSRTALGKTLDHPADDDEKNARDAVLKSTREQIQTISWYVLSDFAKFLDDHLQGLSGGALVTTLTNAISAIGGLSVWAALGKIRDVKNLDAVVHPFKEGAAEDWPRWRFAFADAQTGTVLSPGGVNVFQDATSLNTALEEVEKIADEVWKLLPQAPPAAQPPLVAQTPLEAREGWFVIRCVFDSPNCGPLKPPVVSAPSVPFQMAGFFDPDAPARPIRIALPIDTTPAGLRKFDKNTAFMISDVLCGQIKRVQGMTFGDLVLSVLPWPFHKDLSVGDSGPCGQQGSDASLNFGMMCSLSIPIITICALLLLMIIVNLLDIIFRWIPYFILCFPLPGFKAKR